MKITKAFLKEMIKKELRFSILGEGNVADYPVYDYDALTDDEIIARAEEAGMGELVRHGLENEELRAEVVGLLKKADMEDDPLMENDRDVAISRAIANIEKRYGKNAIITNDTVSPSYIKFITRNLDFRELLIDLWDDMVSGVPMRDVVKTAEESLGYERGKEPFAPMPTVGSEESYLFDILMGIKFHARKIRSGVKYPTGEQVNDAVEGIVGKARQKVRDRQAAADREEARVAALSPEERQAEEAARQREFARKMASGYYGKLD